MVDPSLQDENAIDFSHLMKMTPDTHLKNLIKSNKTLSKIIEDWRKRWLTGSKWTMAELDQLINDMKNNSANVRYQAVVVCSRAVEQLGLMVEKISKKKIL